MQVSIGIFTLAKKDIPISLSVASLPFFTLVAVVALVVRVVLVVDLSAAAAAVVVGPSHRAIEDQWAFCSI